MSDLGTPWRARTISGPQFRVRCEALGLSGKADARVAFGVPERTIRRWELADEIPVAALERLVHLETMADQAVYLLVDRLRAQGAQEAAPHVPIYSLNALTGARRRKLVLPPGWRDEDTVPFGWWRVVVARAARQIPMHVIEAEERPPRKRQPRSSASAEVVSPAGGGAEAVSARGTEPEAAEAAAGRKVAAKAVSGRGRRRHRAG